MRQNMLQCRDLSDAHQDKDERVRKEAQRWLWTVAPEIAERAELPQVDKIPIDIGEYHKLL